MFKEIQAAIHDLAIVKLSYRGQGLRVVEPRMFHIFPGGKRVLCAYQIDGFARSGLVKGWKNFDVAHITEFRRTGEKFSAERPNPTKEEAQELIELCLERDVSDREVINVLERAGVPRAWVTERIEAWRARNKPDAP